MNTAQKDGVGVSETVDMTPSVPQKLPVLKRLNGTLTREEAATRLGVSANELRRRQKLGQVLPIGTGPRGELRFSVQDIDEIRAQRGLAKSPVSYTPEEAARVFQALKNGKNVVDCVIELQVLPGAAASLAAEYTAMTGGLFIDGEKMRAINALPLDGTLPITKAEDLLATLEAYAENTCVECTKRPRMLCKHCVTAAIRAKLSDKEGL